MQITDLILAAQYRQRTHELGDGWQQSASGLYLPRAYADPWASRPTAVSLFTGAGGFDLGFVQAGWHILAAVEWDVWAVMTYIANLGDHTTNVHCLTAEDKQRLIKAAGNHQVLWSGDSLLTATLPDFAGTSYICHHRDETPPTPHVFLGDIRKLTGEQILAAIGRAKGDLDCMFGGPPCQGFSNAGKRQVMDPRNSLVFEGFGRLIVETAPRTFVMENVPCILSMVTVEGIPVLDALALQVSNGGYGTYEGIKRALMGMPNARVATKGMPPPQQRPEPDATDDGDEPVEVVEQGRLF